jgi:polyphenol oxidase
VNAKDMLTFKNSASDPIFFGHHANVDRLWELWKSLPGGVRTDISDPDYLNTQFTFYNEDGAVVNVSVAQALQIDQLR